MGKQQMHAGIDLSTTTARCIILDADLNVRAVGRCPHTSIADKLRQSTDRWISSVESAIRVASGTSGIDLDQIVSIGIATQGIASALVDEQGAELRAANSWLSSGDAPAGIFSTETIESWYSQSGRRITPVTLAGRLLCERTTSESGRWVLAGDLIAHQLSGEWVIDPCLAATTGLLDQCIGDWSDPLLKEVGVERTSLSRITPSGAAAGYARGKMSQRLGLSPDVVVASPTQDQRAAVLVADPLETSVTVTFGTAVAIVRRARDCRSRLPAQVPLTPGLRSDTWWHEGVVLAVGATFDWCAELMGVPTESWLDLAADIAVGSSRITCDPWFGGRGSAKWEPGAKGALRGLQLDATRSEVARAVVDAVCDEIGRNVALVGAGDDVRIIGRASLHSVIAQTVASILGRPVTRVLADEPTAFGAALLGAQASGHIGSAHAASLTAIRAEVIKPERVGK